jgi:hypothetical protein
MQNNQKIVTKEQASFTELLDDQEAIILDLENLHYYTLNAAAIVLWKRLCTGAAQTATALTAALQKAFGLNPEQAELDARDFLAQLSRNGLIEFVTGELGASSTAASFASSDDLPAYTPPQLKLSNSLTQVVLSQSATIATTAITGPG